MLKYVIAGAVAVAAADMVGASDWAAQQRKTALAADPKNVGDPNVVRGARYAAGAAVLFAAHKFLGKAVA